MPSASPQYTLVGFSPELDWRPLTFLDPVSSHRVCSACGLVRRRTALLPCMHVLCSCCYEQCTHDGSRSCPLDRNGYHMKDVVLTDVSADELLIREVRCWNEASGCQYTTAASGIARHFQRECEHHSARCSKCSAAVLCRDVCAHLRSACCNTTIPHASENTLSPDHLDKAVCLPSFKEASERQAGELAACQRAMAVDITTHGDRLNEISHSINTLKETLSQELGFLKRQNDDSLMKSQMELASSKEELKSCFVACSDTVNTCLRNIIGVDEALNDKYSGTLDALSQIAAAIEQVKENGLKTLAQVTGLPIPSQPQTTQCEFFVRRVQFLQDTAIEQGWAEYDSERVYLRGYCMSLGVYLQKQPESVSLCGKYTLHMGVTDDAVRWPFRQKIRMSVLHPEGGEDAVELTPFVFNPANHRRPVSSNQPYFLKCFILEDLLVSGYAKDDQLRIKWELLPWYSLRANRRCGFFFSCV